MRSDALEQGAGVVDPGVYCFDDELHTGPRGPLDGLIDPQRYSPQGGGFPVIVRSVGPLGPVAVSDQPQLEDNRLVVSAIRAHL
jgi:hypothetical protein